MVLVGVGVLVTTGVGVTVLVGVGVLVTTGVDVCVGTAVGVFVTDETGGLSTRGTSVWVDVGLGVAS